MYSVITMRHYNVIGLVWYYYSVVSLSIHGKDAEFANYNEVKDACT